MPTPTNPIGFTYGPDGTRRPITQAYPGPIAAPPTSYVPPMPEDYRAGEESPYEYILRTQGSDAAAKFLADAENYYATVAQGPGDLFPGLPKNPTVSAPNFLVPGSLERTLREAVAGGAPQAPLPRDRDIAQGPQGPRQPQESVWWTYPKTGETKIVRSVLGPGGFSDFLRTRE